MSAAADKAVAHVLQRLLRDPRLAHLISAGSEAFDLLTAAYAEAHGFTVEHVRADFERQMAPRRWRGEMLDWHDAHISKPDADLTVVCLDADDVWAGHWDGVNWIDNETHLVVHPTHFADPKGPR